MKIRAEINQIYSGKKPVKAFADIILDDVFVIHDVAIVEKGDKRFVSMPSKSWLTSDGESRRRDMCHPIDRDLRAVIENAAFAAYYSATADID